MLGIAKFFGKGPSGAAIEALVRQVTETSLEEVLERVCVRVDQMTLSEARGYVRARAAQVVRRQTRLTISKQKNADFQWADSIVPAATERLVPLVLRRARVGVPRVEQRRLAA